MRNRSSRWAMGVAIAVFLSGTGIHAAAPPDFDFSGFPLADVLRNVYTGRFNLIKESLIPADRPTIEGARAVATLLYTYHRAYSQDCIDATGERFSIDEVDTQGKPRVRIRERFFVVYKTAKIHAILGAMDLREGGISMLRDNVEMLQLIGMFQLLLVTQHCNSETATQLEENLVRAYLGQPPVQATQAGAAQAPLFFRGCTAVVREMRPGAAADAPCGCLLRAFQQELGDYNMRELEDHFTREKFLITAYSKSGLHEKVAQCLP